MYTGTVTISTPPTDVKMPVVWRLSFIATTQEQADRIGAIERTVFGYAALSLKLDKLLAERDTQSAA
jgi:hypothetical protein